MPSSITHQLIAEEALALFPERAQQAVRFAPDEYYLGCQGPDVFFFYRIGNRSEYNLGKFLHRYRVYDFFSLLLGALRGEEGAPVFGEKERQRVLAYALGYIAHYAADSRFHPFVYRYMEETGAEKREHQQMENDWDVWFLRERKGQSAEKFSFAFSEKKLIKDGTLARLYAYLARKLEREEVTARRFRGGIKNFSRYLSFFHGKCYAAQRRWEGAEKFFHVKRFLSRLYPRENIDPAYVSGEHFLSLTREAAKDADGLFALAVKDTARLAALFLEAERSGEALPRADFGNGLLTGEQVD